MLTPEQYLKVLSLGFQLNPPPMVSGLVGRIIRGKNPEDFEKLSDDPNRKIVFLTDSLGLSKMFGKSGYDMLIAVGHHSDHIKKQVQAGKSYKIVVFPAVESEEATWEGLSKVTIKSYPDLADDFCKFYPDLTNSKYDDFEKAAGYKFADVDDYSNPRFMSYDKYINSKRTVVEFRAFLYHVLHIRELFSGDGYTYDEKGKRGLREFLILNKRISDIKNSVVGDIQVTIP